MATTANTTTLPDRTMTYNLRASPRTTDRWNAYIAEANLREAISTPRTKRKIHREVLEARKRITGHYDKVPHPSEVLDANEIVSGGRPAEWHLARHEKDFWDEWEKAIGIGRKEFEKGWEYIPWLDCEVKAPKITEYCYGAIDMAEPFQGRMMTAKRIDGKDIDPGLPPEVDEMSWREWRKISRAGNLLLEAVDGVPWGWEMSDEEWESRQQMYNVDETENLYLLNWTRKREAYDREDERLQEDRRKAREKAK